MLAFGDYVLFINDFCSCSPRILQKVPKHLRRGEPMESTCIFLSLSFCVSASSWKDSILLENSPPESSSRCQVGKKYSVRYETSVMVAWHQWKDMKRWTLGKQHRFHVSSMATQFQWGEAVREALCLTLCVCLIRPLSGHYPGPLFGCQPACQKQLASPARPLQPLH